MKWNAISSIIFLKYQAWLSWEASYSAWCDISFDLWSSVYGALTEYI
jgi:hypothetical protein